MHSLSYDLHIHSCLSPCGDDDMTPGNIVGMSALKGLNVIAVTDHNSCRNCQAVMKLASEYDMLIIPGMELTTMEEVHVVCLFPELNAAMEFDSYVYGKLLDFKNDERVFGKQQLLNEKDEITGTLDKLLISATDISFDEVYGLVKGYGGVMIPAHIDKNANSLISNFGFIPPDSLFECVELKELKNLHKMKTEHPYISNCNIISNSDAHYLEHIHEAEYSLYVSEKSVKGVLEALVSRTNAV